MKFVLLLILLGVCVGVNGFCDGKQCRECLMEGCWYCGGPDGSKCVEERICCPNRTIHVLPPHFPEECAPTTTAPPTTTPATSTTLAFAYVGYVVVGIVGTVLLLLLTYTIYYYAYLKRMKQQEYRSIAGSNQYQHLYQAEAEGRIAIERGPHCFENPIYGIEEEGEEIELYARPNVSIYESANCSMVTESTIVG